MMSAIRTFFSKANITADVSPWLRELGDANIFVISATVSEGIDASTMTKVQLLDEIRQALERDKQNQKNGYGLFVYRSDGQRRPPFFTSDEHAQKFCGEYSKEHNRVFPFMILKTKGTFLGKIAPSSSDLNSRS